MLMVFIIGGVVVLGLALYLAYLYYQIRLKNTQQESVVEALIQKRQESQVYARDSIVILLRGWQQDQVSMTEVAIRVAGLVQVLDETERAQYQVFESLANDASHIPIKEAWKALSKQDKRKFDQEREALEARYQAKVAPLVEAILTGTETSAPVVQLFEPAKHTLH